MFKFFTLIDGHVEDTEYQFELSNRMLSLFSNGQNIFSMRCNGATWESVYSSLRSISNRLFQRKCFNLICCDNKVYRFYLLDSSSQLSLRILMNSYDGNMHRFVANSILDIGLAVQRNCISENNEISHTYRYYFPEINVRFEVNV